MDLIVDSLPALLEATVLTLELLLLSLAAGMCLAIPLGILRVQKSPLLWRPVHWYIYFWRGTPLLVQLFLVYYGLAQFEFVRTSFVWSALRSPFWCALITMSLHTAGYTANILRGGIEGVPHGEVEAARAIGMSGLLLYRRIILPRAFRLAIPAYGNEIIGMLKGSALASTVTLPELTGVARKIVAATYAPYEIFVTAGLIYLAITFVATRLIHLLEYRLNPHLRPLVRQG
jgi:polar amino acid transport system permease protein/octopine/nopaline transport system permease protein